jgi:hypothetical protein
MLLHTFHSVSVGYGSLRMISVFTMVRTALILSPLECAKILMIYFLGIHSNAVPLPTRRSPDTCLLFGF